MIRMSLPDISVRILDHAREHAHVSIDELIESTGIRSNTLEQHFRQWSRKVI
jgi:hypothetical protein